MKRVLYLWLALAALAAVGIAPAAAHGGLTMDQDMCRLRIGPYSMHFAGYQPERTLDAEFCEDIPSVGPTVIVLDMAEPALRKAEISLKIVKDTGQGPDGDAVAPVILDIPPAIYESGSVPVRTTFNEPGRFVGLVTARFPAVAAEPYVSRFPFAVGGSRFDFYAVLEIAALLAGAGAVIYSLRRGVAAKNPAST